MSPLVRIFLLLGLICLVIGGLIFLAERLGLHVGRLPGDIRIQRGNLTCFFPLATMILLSAILTVLVNLILRLFRK